MAFKLGKLLAAALLTAGGSGCVVLVPFIESDLSAERSGQATSYAYPVESCDMAENPVVHFFTPQPVGASAQVDSYQGIKHPNQAPRERRASSGAKPQLEQLIAQLRQGDDVIRTHAASDLGMMGIRASSAVDELIYALKHDKSKWVRRAAARSLGKIGNKNAVPALEYALKDSNKFVVQSARNSLKRLSLSSAK